MTHDEFINTVNNAITKYAPSYNIQVHSPIIAQAILESAWGTSYKGQSPRNNLFGMKYREGRVTCNSGTFVDESVEQKPDGSYTEITDLWYSFASYEDSVHGYFQFINVPNYANLKGVTDPVVYLNNLRADGYATSLNYVNNLINCIKTNNLTRFDNVKPSTPPTTAPYVYKGLDYSLVFNSTYYTNKYADLKQAFGTDPNKLFQHFIMYGMQELRQAKSTFNPVAYKNRYADLRAAFGDNNPMYYQHYIQCGVKEGRIAL